MTAPPASGAWTAQQARWTAVYAAQLPAQLRRVISFVHAQRRDPAALAPHFDSLLALLDRAAAAGEDALWLELVAALHPLPLRWRRWDAWGGVLDQAAARCADLGDPAGQARYLAAAAGLQRHYGRLEEALQTALAARDLAAAAGAADALAEAGSTAVAALRYLGRVSTAVALLEDVEEQFKALTALDPAAAARAQTLLDLQRMDLLRGTGNLPAAVALADRLAAPLEAAPDSDPHLVAAVLRRQATIYWAAGRYPAAATGLQRSAALFTAAGDPLEALFSRGNLGLVYYGMARYAAAEACMREVIAAAEELNAHWRLIRDMGNLAAVYLARGQLDAALTYAQRHLDLALRFGDRAEQARAENNRAAIRMYLGDAAAALPDLQAAHDRYLAQERPEGYLAGLVDLALAHYLLGDMPRSLELVARLMDHPVTASYPVLSLLALRARALTEDAATAVSTLTTALALARRHNRPLDEAACLLALAALAEDEARQKARWTEGAALLAEMGATAWLDGRSPANPPLIALIL